MMCFSFAGGYVGSASGATTAALVPSSPLRPATQLRGQQLAAAGAACGSVIHSPSRSGSGGGASNVTSAAIAANNLPCGLGGAGDCNLALPSSAITGCVAAAAAAGPTSSHHISSRPAQPQSFHPYRRC